MMQIQEMSRDEKLAMYLKLSKRDLAEMLIPCNALLSARQSVIVYPQPSQYVEPAQLPYYPMNPTFSPPIGLLSPNGTPSTFSELL